MNILSTQKQYLDKPAVENHARLLREYMMSAVVSASKDYTKEDCDSLYFGAHNLDVISKLRMPLMAVIRNPSKTPITINIHVKRDGAASSGYDNGKSSMNGDGYKNMDLFTSSDGIWYLGPRSRLGEKDTYCKWNLRASRPNSIQSAIDSIEYGGGSVLSCNSMRHLIANRLSRVDTMRFTCVNMYMWLQKCILYYSTSDDTDIRVYGKTKTVTVVGHTPQSLINAVKYRDVYISKDNLTDEELMVLIIGLEGHESVRLEHNGRDDIYTKVVTQHAKYSVFTKEVDPVALNMQLTLLPPERALSTIYNVAVKLGILLDWLSTPDIVRGLASYKQKCERILNTGSVSETFTIDAPMDSHYGTLVDGIVNGNMYDTAQHSNLGASTCSLIIEELIGYQMINNVHYTSEALGILNSNMFANNASGGAIYRSFMIENDLYHDGPDNKLVKALMSNTANVSLGGNVQYFKQLIDQYRRVYSSKFSERTMWLQVNHFYGTALCNNSSEMIGKPVEIGSSTVGSTISDMKKATEVQNWLCMHFLTQSKVYKGGLSNIGNYPMPAYSEALNGVLTLVEGVYKCTMCQITMPKDMESRKGYDSRINDDLYYVVTYFSQGGNDGRQTGEQPLHPENPTAQDSIAVIARIEEHERIHAERKRALINEERIGRKAKYREDEEEQVEPEPRPRSTIQGTHNESIIQSPNGKDVHKQFRKRTLNVGTIKSSQRDAIDRAKSHMALKNPIISRSNTEEDVASQVSNGEHGKSHFKIHTVEGDGNCGLRAFIKAADNIGIADGAAQIAELVNWDVNGEWQESNSMHAMAQMINCNSTVFTTNEAGEYITEQHRVEDPDGHIYLLFRGNHFDALEPSARPVEGGVSVNTDNGVGSTVVRYGLKPEVAVVYEALLRQNGIEAKAVMNTMGGASVHGSCDIQTDVDTSKAVVSGMRPEIGKSKGHSDRSITKHRGNRYKATRRRGVALRDNGNVVVSEMFSQEALDSLKK